MTTRMTTGITTGISTGRTDDKLQSTRDKADAIRRLLARQILAQEEASAHERVPISAKETQHLQASARKFEASRKAPAVEEDIIRDLEEQIKSLEKKIPAKPADIAPKDLTATAEDPSFFTRAWTKVFGRPPAASAPEPMRDSATGQDLTDPAYVASQQKGVNGETRRKKRATTTG